MEAVWILETDETIDVLTTSILPMMTKEDRLFIGQLGMWSATHLLPEAHEYLSKIVN